MRIRFGLTLAVALAGIVAFAAVAHAMHFSAWGTAVRRSMSSPAIARS